MESVEKSSRSIVEKYAAVALDLALHNTLDYEIPEPYLGKVKPGMRVKVFVRGKLRYGNVVNLKQHPEVPSVKPIESILSNDPYISDDLMQLAQWMSRYYATALTKVLKMLLPSSVRKEMAPKIQQFVRHNKTREQLRKACAQMRSKNSAQAAVLDVMLQVEKGILLTELCEKARVSRSPIDTLAKKGFLHVETVTLERSPLEKADYFTAAPKKLNSEQQTALQAITENLSERCFSTHLLHGVTGSGKTEIYLQAIDYALEKKLGTIVLVPEIALTTQLIERFRARFEGKIALLHHRLSQGEKNDTWHKIHKGEAPIVIGARSALFSPIPNLGLIIVDEEHESSYKQTDEMPCYHARDVAVMRGHLTKSTAILGSATPSLESYKNALEGKYKLLTLSERPTSSPLPAIHLVDMRLEDEKQKRRAIFSDPLLQAIKKRHERGEQTLLFLNRRGYHTTLICQTCQKCVECPHCDMALTFHRSEQSLSCHLCGYLLFPPPTTCTQCHQNTMKYRGIGTEQVERTLHAVLPEIRTIRMDADTTRHKGSHQKLLRQFGTGKADVLIGTQMIAKGLHFPSVTLVGILNPDSALQIPDFRASEGVFQLITQVAGRSGRSIGEGEVILQTRLPDNPTIQFALKQDYLGFYDYETTARKTFRYPPYCRLIRLLFAGKDPQATSNWATQIAQHLKNTLPPTCEIEPPLPAGYPKIQNTYRFHIIIKTEAIAHATAALQQIPSQKGVKMTIDTDPLSTF